MEQEKDLRGNNDTSLGYESQVAELQGQSEFLALLPLKNVVMLPTGITPIIVARSSSILAVEFALKQHKTIFITAQKDSRTENPTQHDVFALGTKATILQVSRMPNGALKILAEGICRARMISAHYTTEFMSVMCEDVPTVFPEPETELVALWRQLKELCLTYSKLNDKMPSDVAPDINCIQDLDHTADTVALHIPTFSFQDRQAFLETANLKERLLMLCVFLSKEIEILQTEQKIRGLVQTQVDKSQREYYLNEQMKAIQKELGRDDHAVEIAQIRAKLKTLNLTKEALEKAQKELKRLEQMPPLSSEAVVSRHYVDWIISLPWEKMNKDTVTIAQAEKILNKNHAGLSKAKDRILEFLAAKKFSESLERSATLCLVGPPGVGKTSLVRSIAKSLGRDFVRISLGGIKDEAEIRGHRRTYIGALPGKILQAIKKAKTVNPVILLDEIDKMSRDIHGDPAAALLEVLDPEQNKTFVDHFLDLDYDLSKVMFISTANTIEGIPYPLFDRMEIINLAGYTDDEKITIAKSFLIPKQLKEYNLRARQFKITDEELRHIISEYTKEAGVRQLERVLAKLMRKVIQILLKTPTNSSIHITPDLIKEWLGHATFKKTSLNAAQERIGLATGLAWTELGGDVLEIEATALVGKGNISLTGQLGDVMQESAHAAISYIRSRATSLGLASSFHTTKDIHIHIPEGATPKDGPSAGISICTALISALTKIPTKHKLAMTGEITLQGRVLSIGGLKEKLLAAKQHAITTVIVPEENRDDVEEILKDTDLTGVTIVFVRTMDEVINNAFEVSPFSKAKQEPKTKAKRSTKEKQTIKRKKKSISNKTTT